MHIGINTMWEIILTLLLGTMIIKSNGNYIMFLEILFIL